MAMMPLLIIACIHFIWNISMTYGSECTDISFAFKGHQWVTNHSHVLACCRLMIFNKDISLNVNKRQIVFR